MADMTDAQFRQKVLDVLDETGAFIKDDIEQVSTIDGNVILPGYNVNEDGDPVKYVCAPMTVFAQYAQDAATQIQQIWLSWYGEDDAHGVRLTWATWLGGCNTQWTTLTDAVTQATQRANIAAETVEGAVSTANQASETARQAAATATGVADQWNNTYKQQIESATSQANNARDAAAGAADEWNKNGGLKDQVNTAISQTNTAKQNAQSAADDWNNNYKTPVQTATSEANAARDAAAGAANEWNKNGGLKDQINTAKSNAEAATADAENVNAVLSSSGDAVILTVTNRNGQPTSKEVGFRIYRTYASVAAMNADAANVPEGRFVLIDGNVEVADTGKLYVKNSSGSFSYLTDLSGAQGIKGDKGDTPILTALPDGTIYSDGVKLTEIIKDAVDAFTQNEGTSSSAAGDGSRWGAYKTAENNRDTAFGTSQTTRQTAYETTEGSTSSVADDGSRWGAYKKAEADRGTAYGTAEDVRDALYATEEGTSASPRTENSRWGKYAKAEYDRDAAYGTAEGNSGSMAGDGSRWGAYKTEAAGRDANWDTYKGQKDLNWTNYKNAKDTDWDNYKGTKDTDFGNYKSAKDTDWTGYKATKDTEWNTFKQGKSAEWTNWFGADDTSGVQKQWKDTKADAISATNAANTQADRAQGYNDHPWQIGNDGYIYVWDEDTEAMVRTNKMIIDFDDLTQQQKQELISLFFSTIVFDDAPVQNSPNAVKSGGIYDALATKQDTLTFASNATCQAAAAEIQFS